LRVEEFARYHHPNMVQQIQPVLASSDNRMLERKRRRRQTIDYYRHNYDLYLFLLPGLVCLAIFKYLPIFGITVALKDFTIREGILGSPWAEPLFIHFDRLFALPHFWRVIRNTILVNLYMLVFQWPLPIILAILINEIMSVPFKRIAQTVTYMPHFLSWVVVGTIFLNILSPDSGIVNRVIVALGGEPVLFFGRPRYFRGILVVSQAWKETGWASIVYLASLQAIDPQLYDAAKIDGANKAKQIRYITIPGLVTTMVFILLLRISRFMMFNVQQIIIMDRSRSTSSSPFMSGITTSVTMMSGRCVRVLRRASSPPAASPTTRTPY
jgi:putative aldouronate transport system permease protein